MSATATEKELLRAARGAGRRRRVRGALIAVVIAGGLALAADARARPKKRGAWVVGRTIQVTADRIFVDFGARFGLRRGDAVAIRLPDRSWLKLSLSEVASSSASAELPAEGPWPPNGSLARARWRPPPPAPPRQRARLLPPPDAPEVITARWRGVDRRRPEPVPFSQTLAAKAPPPRDRTHGSLRLEYMGLINTGGSVPADFHQLGLWSDLDVPQLGVDWLDYSHRVRFRLQLAKDIDQRRFAQAHGALPLVYRARLGVNLAPFRAELGRMLGAPTPEAEVVDGGAARVRINRWLFVGAYGGLQPRPLDLRPSADATQFGGYASLRLGPGTGSRGRSWAVLGDVGFVGSTWMGAMDRKALTARAAVDWAGLSLSGHAVVDLYGAGHPSGRSNADLTILSVAADARLGSMVQLGAAYDRYRLVGTREALLFFGDGYVDQAANNSIRGSCDVRLGSQTWIGAQGGLERQAEENYAFWGELMLRTGGLLHDEDLLRLSAGANRGNVLFGVGGRLAYARPLWSWLFATLSYGLHRDQYSAIAHGTLRHELLGGFDAVLGQHWLLGTEVGTIISDEDRALQIFATLAFVF